MTLKTGMFVGILGTADLGVLIQIRSASNTCVIKLNDGTLKKNVPLEQVEEAKDMNDIKTSKTIPLRLAPEHSPSKLTSLPVETRESRDHVKLATLEVNDSVRARCNGGSRWFPGKIIRVQRNGTYDVEYADGDIEKAMAASDVEKVETSWSLAGFAVGDKVDARYKKGAKFFSGKVTRLHANGTYDIAYDDGDVELRVEKAFIVASKRATDDDGLRTITKTRSTAAFRVDQRVRTRYQSGKKLVVGKIQRVHSDGTYDIQYNNGEKEKRVKEAEIEAVSESDEKPRKGLNTLTVGKKVDVRYKKGKRLYRGKISKVHANGTYDVEYDDGEVETYVEAKEIEVLDEEEDLFADSDNDTRQSTGKRGTRWEVGDRVKAYYGKGRRLFPGKVTKVHANGTYDIKYDDGDAESRVEGGLIEGMELDGDDLEKVERPRGKDSLGSGAHPTKSARLCVGDAVEAKYKRGSRFFKGEITRERMDGTYDIKYQDGDVEERVEVHLIRRIEDKTSMKKTLNVGDRVKARYNKGSKLVCGEIIAVHGNGTYDLRYENGDKEKRVEAKDIEVDKDDHESHLLATNCGVLKVGDRIEAKYKNGKKSFPGKISRVHSDGTYDIIFDDGDSEQRVDQSRIQVLRAKDGKTRTFAVGDVVKAKYQKGLQYYTGKIARVRVDGTYDVDYDDGDSETRLDAALIVAVEFDPSDGLVHSTSQAKRFEIGDVIKARYKKGVKYLSGRITKARSDGTYDIRYEDGEMETHVERSYIQDNATTTSVDEEVCVGDRVNARFKGGSKAFPGKIVKVRMDGTFDVEYDDGDTELRMKRSSIETIDKDTKKEVKDASFHVDERVEANFRSKGKFQRGKIVRARADGTYDIEYDVGGSEMRVAAEEIRKVDAERDESERDARKSLKKTSKVVQSDTSSDSECERVIKSGKSRKTAKKRSLSSSSGSDGVKHEPLKKGDRVTYRKAADIKSRRVGSVRKVRSDGTCDVKYADGDTSKRIASNLLIVCSDSEDSDEVSSKLEQRAGKGREFLRHQSVWCNWRRSSKFARPRTTDKWTEATVLARNSDGTYTIRYSDDVVEEDAPLEALRVNPMEKEQVAARRKRSLKRTSTSRLGIESLFLLEQLAMTLFEEGGLHKKPKLKLLSGGDSSSSESSSSSSTESESNSRNRKDEVDKILQHLFDAKTLAKYRQLFNDKDVKSSGKISRGRVIALVEELLAPSASKCALNDDNVNSVSHLLTEWFTSRNDLRIHRHFDFMTLMLAFAFAKFRLGKVRMEQSVATVLEGRFASYHEHQRQLEVWQQKLGYRLFETLQRHFHCHALATMIPSRIQVSKLSTLFHQVARQSVPNKPLALYLQQHELFPHHTLLLPEFLCAYYQLYGSEQLTQWTGQLELRPIAFVASCLFSNGDNVCIRHGDLVRRLAVGRTPAQTELILRFREAFESLMNLRDDGVAQHEEQLLETSQLSAFAAKVAPDPSLLEPALTLLRKRSAAVSLVEIFGSCGFLIDELTSAPTVRNAIEKMRMRVDVADARRVIGLVRNLCIKILRFPNNADYWRLRADTEAFQHKLGRVDGATSLLEAVGFIEYKKTHYELRGARTSDGKRSSALEKTVLDTLREKCVQLDGELALFDGVESITSILQRISSHCEKEGKLFTRDECQRVLKNLSSYIENVLKKPKDSRYWRIREANSTFQRQIGYLPYAMELMESIGFDLLSTSCGDAYALRGTGLTGKLPSQSKEEARPWASLSNFAFSSVSSQMEWFLWRRKQELDSLLEDEMRYLHDIVGNLTPTDGRMCDATEAREAALVKMYPYGTNAIETFSKTSIQRMQVTMMQNVFKKIDVEQKGFLLETDFSRIYGSPATLPPWSQFDAFDIGKDGKMDMNDFVAALGPLVDHSYELFTGKNGHQMTSWSEGDTLCEVTSRAVGDLRLGTSSATAVSVLEALLSHLHRLIQEPENSTLWSIHDNDVVGRKLLRFPASRELLRLVGFQDLTNVSKDGAATRHFELLPDQRRFQTSHSELPLALESTAMTRIQTIAAMCAGHYRGLKHLCVSDIGAVSRALCAAERSSDKWLRVVQLGIKCLKNIETQPDNPRYREIYTTTNTFINTASSVQGGLELLLSLGFRETDAGSLVVPFDTSLDQVKARRVELEIGEALLVHNKDSKRAITSVRASQGGLKDDVQQQARKRKSGARSRPAAASTQVSNLSKTVAMKQTVMNQSIQSSSTKRLEVLERGTSRSNLSQRVGGNLRDMKVKTLTRGRAATKKSNNASMNRKHVQRRAPNNPSLGIS